MGLAALAARTDAEYYYSEAVRECDEVEGGGGGAPVEMGWGGGWGAGGGNPLPPYILTGTVDEAFRISVMVTGFALLAFGAVKGHFTG